MACSKLFDLVAGAGHIGSDRARSATLRVHTGGNYPNPVQGTTTIDYALEETEFVRLAVYDALGREHAILHQGMQDAGSHQVVFDASGMRPGTYFYRIETATASQTLRFVIQ